MCIAVWVSNQRCWSINSISRYIQRYKRTYLFKKNDDGNSFNDFPFVDSVTAKNAPSPVLPSRHSTSNTLPVSNLYGALNDTNTDVGEAFVPVNISALTSPRLFCYTSVPSRNTTPVCGLLLPAWDETPMFPPNKVEGNECFSMKVLRIDTLQSYHIISYHHANLTSIDTCTEKFLNFKWILNRRGRIGWWWIGCICCDEYCCRSCTNCIFEDLTTRDSSLQCRRR